MAAPPPDPVLTLEEYKERLRKHWEVLETCMEYEYGLNNEIDRKLIFSEKEMKKLKYDKPDEVSTHLLEFLAQKETIAAYKDFLDALTKSLQSHLKEQIRKDGKFDVNEKDKPLTDDQRKHIRRNNPALVEIFSNEISSLLDRMIVCDCINDWHKRDIRGMKEMNQIKKSAETLLEIVKNRSLDHFQKFREILREIRSRAFELTDFDRPENIEGTTTVGLVAKTSTDTLNNENLSEEQKAAAKEERQNLEREVTEKIGIPESESQVEGIKIAVAETGQSVKLYLVGLSTEKLAELEKYVLDEYKERLRASVEKLFNDLLGNGKPKLLVKKVFLVDFSMQQFRLNCDIKNVIISDQKSEDPLLRNGGVKMRNVFGTIGTILHQNIRKRILMSAFMWRIINGRKLYSRPQIEACESLSSVSRDWWKLAKEEAFKATVRESRKQLRKNYDSVKLYEETCISMTREVACAVNWMDDVYVVMKEDASYFYLYQPIESTREPSTQLSEATQQITALAAEVSKPGENIASLLEEQTTAFGPTQSTEELSQITQAVGEMTRSVQPILKRKKAVNVSEDRLERIQVADNVDISSVEATDDQSGIFCVSKTDGTVWFWTKSEPRNKANVMKQFSPCTSITISPKGRLRTVVLRDYNALEMHNPSSELIQIMHLPDHIGKAHDVVCDNEGEIFVSYGSDKPPTNPLHRVSKISRRGKAILTYGNMAGSDTNQLSNPYRIALDQDDGILYVADIGNARILALDENLNLINVVLDSKSDGIENLNAVKFDKITKRLLVAYGKLVKVYRTETRGKMKKVKSIEEEKSGSV